ncbi:MAG: ion transporter [Alphaproteobacteria bacterium]|nr:ion transporter [Alphaproteobacteria bacterium]
MAIKKKPTINLYYKDEQRRLSKLVTGFSFEMFIMSIILADAVVLGLMTSDIMSYYFNKGLFLLDRLFMGIFIFEMFLKIYALKKKFFTSGWNIFDLAVVIISSIPEATSFIVLRSFRLLRLFKYMHHFSKINNLINIIIGLLPSFLSFLMIFAVFSYVFAIIGVSLFGNVFINFSTLGLSILTLLQSLTIDGWITGVVRPILVIFPHAWIYFVSQAVLSFLIIVSFIVSAFNQIQKQNLPK